MSSPLDRVRLPVSTTRLVIRRAVPEDAAATWAFRSLPEVQEWIGGGSQGLEEWRERVHYGTDDDVTLLFCLPDGTVIGDLMVIVRDAWAQREVADRARAQEALLGWTLDPAYGGRGLATEAVAALLDLCFAAPPRGLGVRRVVAEAFQENEPSWRLMERLGMRREAHAIRDSLHRDRGWLDGVTYALLADEWRVSS